MPPRFPGRQRRLRRAHPSRLGPGHARTRRRRVHQPHHAAAPGTWRRESVIRRFSSPKFAVLSDGHPEVRRRISATRANTPVVQGISLELSGFGRCVRREIEDCLSAFGVYDRSDLEMPSNDESCAVSDDVLSPVRGNSGEVSLCAVQDGGVSHLTQLINRPICTGVSRRRGFNRPRFPARRTRLT